MAGLNGDLLGAQMQAAVDAVDPSDRVALFKALGNAITSHIQANAVVDVTSVSGVFPGGGVSGAGTGTIS